MHVDVSSQIVIRRPREQVAAFAMNPDNGPRWYVNIKSVAWKTPPPLTVGSRIAFVAEFLGRRLEYTCEIAELAPGERLVMRTSEGPFPMETTYQWESVEDGSTAHDAAQSRDPTGFARVFAPFMTMAIRRATRKDLSRLKQILEHH